MQQVHHLIRSGDGASLRVFAFLQSPWILAEEIVPDRHGFSAFVGVPVNIRAVARERGKSTFALSVRIVQRHIA